MSSQGTNFGTNAYSSSNRRRNGGVFVGTDGSLELRVTVGNVSQEVTTVAATPLAVQTWNRITIVWNRFGGFAQLFVNGSGVGQLIPFVPRSDLVANDGELLVGGGTEGGLDVAVSGFALWDLALNMTLMPSDVASCMLRPRPATGLLGFFSLTQTLASAIDTPPTPAFKDLEVVSDDGPVAATYAQLSG